MAWFSKKPDPISDRARALNEEIAHLEGEIKRLDAQLKRSPPPPRLRSTAVPHGTTVPHASDSPVAGPRSTAGDPIFEEVNQDRFTADGEEATADHYNDLGIRKYDLPALLRRLRNHFRGPSTSNPKLVSYLAAGGIQGLRPLRIEKRVTRNQIVFFAALLFLFLLGLFAALLRLGR